MTTQLLKEFDPWGSSVSHPGLGLGNELEQIQRVAKAQIMNYLPPIIEQLQDLWDAKDHDYAELTNTAYSKITIPTVEKQNFYTGIKPSLLEAPVSQWPSITVYSHNSKPSVFQADQYDQSDVALSIEVLCNIGPLQQQDLHKKEGILKEQYLDSQLQRLSDAVHMCIKKDSALGGVINGEIEKPPIVTQSLPWSRQEKEGIGGWYIFQGKLLEYTVQKNSY